MQRPCERPLVGQEQHGGHGERGQKEGTEAVTVAAAAAAGLLEGFQPLQGF